MAVLIFRALACAGGASSHLRAFIESEILSNLWSAGRHQGLAADELSETSFEEIVGDVANELTTLPSAACAVTVYELTLLLGVNYAEC